MSTPLQSPIAKQGTRFEEAAPAPVAVNISHNPLLDGGTFQVIAPGFANDVPRLNKGGDGRPARIQLRFELTTPVGVEEVTLWFPEGQFSASREVRFDANDGWTTTLTMRSNCLPGTYPFGVHLRLANNFAGPLHLPGNQLAEGHSHPACIVEP